MDQGLSTMELKIMDLIKIFNEYTVRLGLNDLLEEKELRELVEKEIPNFILVSFLPESG